MEVPAGKSGAHAGRDKKQSNPTRKIFEIRIKRLDKLDNASQWGHEWLAQATVPP